VQRSSFSPEIAEDFPRPVRIAVAADTDRQRGLGMAYLPGGLAQPGAVTFVERVERFMADAREVMNIRQASQYLGVSPDTLYKYVYEEKIPAFKLGNRWRFKKSKLDQWMEEKSTMRETREKKKPKAARIAAGQ
jgi:excisionase family DNA binding protein